MKSLLRLLLPAAALLAASACATNKSEVAQPAAVNRHTLPVLEGSREHWTNRDLDDKIERQFTPR